MVIDALIKASAARLSEQSPTAKLDVELLLANVLGKGRSWLYTHPQHVLTPQQQQLFQQLLQRRLCGEPISYILQQQEFWSLSFKVNSSVLIPRPESELLVEQALAHFAADQPIKVADLGCGSGAIGLSIAHERPNWQVTLVDSSEAALSLAQENGQQLQLDVATTIDSSEALQSQLFKGYPDLFPCDSSSTASYQGAHRDRYRVDYVLSDWCQQLPDNTFMLMVSNPPYIAADDPHLNIGDVRFEPRQALVAQDNGLAALHEIITQARRCLLPQGWLLLEHGYDQRRAVVTMMRQNGFQAIDSYTDLAGIERVTGGKI